MIRKTALIFLKLINKNIYIKHHFTKKKFYINLYKHKDYWYHGKKRKANSINIFKNWIKPGSNVLEIGGHIGYFSTLFAQLVKKGLVVVFEPDKDNLVFLHRNIILGNFDNIKIVPMGAGKKNEFKDFYIDPITGQNSSFVRHFPNFYNNRKYSGSPLTEMKSVKTNIIKLDDYCYSSDFFPDFVKIDVEGYEWNVISGFASIITNFRPLLIAEIQYDSEKIIKFFMENKYSIYNDEFKRIADYEDYLKYKTQNIFFKP